SWRTPREQEALHREHARISVEIMNLSGRYANCRLKMAIGVTVTVLSGAAALLFSPMLGGAANAYFYLSFIRFFALIGLMITALGLADYVRRGRYRRQIDELESRRSDLKRR